MKYAVIDMGSNSIRLMIAAVQQGQLSHVEKHLEMTRLGAGVNETKNLSEQSMRDTIEAISKFKEMAVAEEAVILGAFATSAVRDAENGFEFGRRVLVETGIEVNIISGADEAELGFKGVCKGLDKALENQRFVIIDIGGGSTELIVGEKSHILYRKSFNVGVVRMTGKHIGTDPVSEREVKAMAQDIKEILAEGIEAVKALSPKAAIGIGGTATTFGTLDLKMAIYNRDKIHNAQVSLKNLEAQTTLLEKLSVEEKRQLVGLMPKRADVIYAGGVILRHILTALDLNSFYVSDYDNLEGILATQELI